MMKQLVGQSVGCSNILEHNNKRKNPLFTRIRGEMCMIAWRVFEILIGMGREPGSPNLL